MICAAYKDIIIPKKQMNQNWEKALAWLKADSWKDLPVGRTEIDGAKVYVLRQLTASKPLSECRYESHRVYADIQMDVKGSEIIRVCLRDSLKITEAYSAEKDIDFLEGEADPLHQIVLAFPLAAVLFPWDVHKPLIAVNEKPAEIEKIVVKVAL